MRKGPFLIEGPFSYNHSSSCMGSNPLSRMACIKSSNDPASSLYEKVILLNLVLTSASLMPQTLYKASFTFSTSDELVIPLICIVTSFKEAHLLLFCFHSLTHALQEMNHGCDGSIYIGVTYRFCESPQP